MMGKVTDRMQSMDLFCSDWLQSRALTAAIERDFAGGQRSFRPLTHIAYKLHRQSNTVFILGSGSSINRLPQGLQATIGMNDSIGLNFSNLLEHVPTFFFIHEPWLPKPVEQARYFDLLNFRSAAYANVPHIYDLKQARMAGVGPENIPPQLHGNTFLNAPIWLASNDEDFIRAALQYLRRSGSFAEGQFGHLVHHMSTMSLAICFALCCGYRNIVMLGVDLKDASYFFDDMVLTVPNHLRPILNRDRAHSHSTADPHHQLRTRSIPFDRYIIIFNQEVVEPLGAKLYIGSRQSLLYPSLPFWPGCG
jgi:hypothetical protein